MYTGLPVSPTSPLLDLDTHIMNELDNIVTSQQVLLQSLGVPCFFVTKHPKLLEKQRVVIEIMTGSSAWSDDTDDDDVCYTAIDAFH